MVIDRTVVHLWADDGIEDEVLHTFGTVVRVGIDPQPNPFSTAIRADARKTPPLDQTFDLPIANPKCQRYSKSIPGGEQIPKSIRTRSPTLEKPIFL